MIVADVVIIFFFTHKKIPLVGSNRSATQPTCSTRYPGPQISASPSFYLAEAVVVEPSTRTMVHFNGYKLPSFLRLVFAFLRLRTSVPIANCVSRQSRNKLLANLTPILDSRYYFPIFGQNRLRFFPSLKSKLFQPFQHFRNRIAMGSNFFSIR